MPKLTDQHIANLMTAHPDWHLEDSVLVRDWEFASFAEAMLFVNRIAELAEQADHHPDIDIRYNKVKLALISHDANGLTNRDAALVDKIQRLLRYSAN